MLQQLSTGVPHLTDLYMQIENAGIYYCTQFCNQVSGISGLPVSGTDPGGGLSVHSTFRGPSIQARSTLYVC